MCFSFINSENNVPSFLVVMVSPMLWRSEPWISVGRAPWYLGISSSVSSCTIVSVAYFSVSLSSLSSLMENTHFRCITWFQNSLQPTVPFWCFLEAHKPLQDFPLDLCALVQKWGLAQSSLHYPGVFVENMPWWPLPLFRKDLPKHMVEEIALLLL